MSETNAVECGEQHLRPPDSRRSAGHPASFGLTTQETLVEEQTRLLGCVMEVASVTEL
jgi:hypothetical protein